MPKKIEDIFPRLVFVSGPKRSVVLDCGDDPDAMVSSNALLIKKGEKTSLCTVFDLAGQRYVDTEVLNGAIGPLKRRPTITAVSYGRALAAAKDMESVGVGTVEMAVAWEVDEHAKALAAKLKSKMLADQIADDARKLYDISCEIVGEEPHDSPRDIVTAVFNCYEDNDLDIAKVGETWASGLLLSIYSY